MLKYTNKKTAKGVNAVHQTREEVFYIPGKKRELLVAAPHHGYIPGSDYYTKEFAALLALSLMVLCSMLRISGPWWI